MGLSRIKKDVAEKENKKMVEYIRKKSFGKNKKFRDRAFRFWWKKHSS
jgi:hypothetical protein